MKHGLLASMATHHDEPIRQRLSPAERRAQVIEVATRVIATRGFWGFSLQQVADAAHVTEPAIVYHFKSKVGLLIAVLEHRDKEDMGYFAQTLGVSLEDVWAENAQFSLQAICTTLMERNAQQPEIVRLYTVLQGESLNEKHPAYSYYQKREERVLRMLTRAGRHDHIENPVREARLLLSVMDGIQVRWLRSHGAMDLLTEWGSFASTRAWWRA